MSRLEETTESNVSNEEKQANLKILIYFLLSKRDLHWEVYKNIENKAIQLLLFNGVMLGLLINLTIYFPDLDGMINLKILHFNAHFLGVNILLYGTSTFFSIIVISKSLFLDTFTDKGFLKTNVESNLDYFVSDPDTYCMNNSILHDIQKELYAELELLRRKNRSNSISTNLSIAFYSIGILFIILSIFSIL